VGSRSTTDLAYIAGFLDGDGSLMLQVKLRSDSRRGVRFMATICLYQDTRHAAPLTWMCERLGIGYLSHRNDGMTELRINGFTSVQKVLTELQPFIRFKKVQVTALLQACTILGQKKIAELSETELRALVDIVFEIKGANYKSKATLSKEVLLHRLGLTL
jgi:LAGLIDADG endonuclease